MPCGGASDLWYGAGFEKGIVSELSVLAQNLIDPKRNTSDAALIVARDAVLTTLTLDGYVTVNADAALRTAVDNATWRMTLPTGT